MEIGDINILVNKAIENGFNENTISQIVFLYFKNNKKIDESYEKIRIGISEEIFNLFMNTFSVLILLFFHLLNIHQMSCIGRWRHLELILGFDYLRFVQIRGHE